jgi:hypothetical protein
MSASTSQGELEPEFRGKTLTPVSPKPLHFPSPANIPILEKSMDPSFSEQMMQNMHPNTFPSMAQHTIIPAPIQPDTEDDGYNSQSDADAQLLDTAAGGNGGSNGHLQAPGQSASDSQNNAAIQSFLQGTHSSPDASSEAAPATPIQEPAEASDPAPPVDPPSSTASQAQLYQSTNGQMDPNAAPSTVSGLNSGGVNFDALLASLAQPKIATPVESAHPPPPSQTATSPTSALPSNPNLPPKPPAQEKPITHPNYTPGDDIRSYHPHSQKDVAASYHTAHAGLPNISTSALPLPPNSYQTTPMSANLPSAVPMHSPAMSGYGQRDGTPMSVTTEEDAPFDYQMQQKFDAFLEFERQNVADGQWSKFPKDSRLFIGSYAIAPESNHQADSGRGNLPTEKVSKRDLFRRFYHYGLIAQISLKNAYGFVQFLDAETCARALHGEQGKKIRGRDMHIEISKPQKNTNNANDGRSTRRRSRSPDYSRGQQTPRGVDRYTSGSQISPRERDFRRARDDYRPGRSPSPRGGRRGIDRYDGRRRTRSRSPPYGRHRSPLRNDLDDGLPLPHRAPSDVPDIQILAIEELNMYVTFDLDF